MRALEDKEEKKSTSNVALLETSERSSTAVGSQQIFLELERKNEKSGESRTDFKRESNMNNQKVPEYVCFVGKFPKTATLSDIQNFVKSKGINFTGVRVGPKKKPNANVFGYVDLPTKEDYDKLLALNRSLYRGRRIRIDHATPKIPSPHRRMMNTRRGNQGVDFDSAEENKPIPPYDRQLVLKLVKLHAALLAKTEVQLNPLSDTKCFLREPTDHAQRLEITPKKKPGRFGSNKQTARSKRYAITRSQNRGRRKEPNYRLSSKNTIATLSTGKDSSGHFSACRGASSRFNSTKIVGVQIASIPDSYNE